MNPVDTWQSEEIKTQLLENTGELKIEHLETYEYKENMENIESLETMEHKEDIKKLSLEVEDNDNIRR